MGENLWDLLARWIRDVGQRFTIRGPGRIAILDLVVGDLLNVAAIRVYRVDLTVACLIRVKSKRIAVR